MTAEGDCPRAVTLAGDVALAHSAGDPELIAFFTGELATHRRTCLACAARREAQR